MKDVFESFIAIRNLALMNCLITMNLSPSTIKIFKNQVSKCATFSKGENPQIANEILRIWDEIAYELRQRSCFHILSVNTIFSGTESIQFLGPKIWELIPNDIKCFENLRNFKTAIKKWKPTSYPCRIRKTYLHGVGFL